MEPGKIIDPQFRIYQLQTKRGDANMGLVTNRTSGETTIKDLGLEEHKYLSSETAGVKEVGGSLMPGIPFAGMESAGDGRLARLLKEGELAR